MYEKNLTEDLRLRLSKDDMDFLRSLSSKRCITISETIRSILGEYRRSLQMMDVIGNAMKAMSKGETFEGITMKEGGEAVHGDTETHKHDIV